ncbi:hypothetical protein, partial [Streptomyces sp. NPDC001919]
AIRQAAAQKWLKPVGPEAEAQLAANYSRAAGRGGGWRGGAVGGRVVREGRAGLRPRRPPAPPSGAA